MSTSESQQALSISDKIVDTNNFHRVILHFDKVGDLADQNSRFAIPCTICDSKDLAIANVHLDEVSEDSHERYAVLPRCGHAFGSECVLQWININRERGTRPTCPTCRSLILCWKGHLPPTFNLGSTSGDLAGLGKDIQSIRTALSTKSCLQCDGRAPLPVAAPLGRERVAPQRAVRQAADRQRDDALRNESFRNARAQEEELWDRLREGNRAMRQTQDLWAQATSVLSNLQNSMERMQEFSRYDTAGLETTTMAHNIENSTTQESRSHDRYDSHFWQRIQSRTEYAQEMASDRVDLARQDAELASALIAGLNELQERIQSRG
ncbi:hypothetical protein F4678DRAFT_485113 [Xylaria arbuscula]|nr:hypothetical protein F4678DRAFT_485113 [Xylaria arbuscula]